MVSSHFQASFLGLKINKTAVDFEFYSSNGKGAFQGQGYLYRNLGK